jgi:Uma2 family endonuclease
MTRDGQTPPVTVTVTAHTVSLLPETHSDFPLFVITVERVHGQDLWKIRHNGRALDDMGVWVHDGQCRCRTVHRPTRFLLPDALRLAYTAAPDVTFNERTAADTYRESQAAG